MRRAYYASGLDCGHAPVEDLPRQLTAEIGHFFAVCKDLDDNRQSTVWGWRDW